MNARGRGSLSFLGTVVTALALFLGVTGNPSAVSVQGAGIGVATVGVTDGHVVALASYTEVNLFVPGTGNPGETGSTNPGNEVVIPYPATQPVTGDYPASVRAGVAGLDQAVAELLPGVSTEVGGYSQGAHVVTEWAARPGATEGHDVTLVTVGDPCTPRTGILVRSAEARTFTGPCSALPPGLSQTVVVQECDPIANFPEKLDGLTLANALAGYTYCHTYGYTPDQMNRQDRYQYQDGAVTYQVIPADPTPPLLRAMHQNGVFLPAEVEGWIGAAVEQSGPGPFGDLGFTPATEVDAASAPVVAPPPPPDPIAQAAQAVQEGWQTIAESVETFTQGVAAPAASPQWAPAPVESPAPTGNVAAVAAAAEQYAPAPEVAWVAAQVQASPLGGFINSLLLLPFG